MKIFPDPETSNMNVFLTHKPSFCRDATYLL
jgi:hypothetical protein